MAEAYIKVWVYPGKEKAALTAMRKTKSVKSARLTAGEQDIVAHVTGKSYEGILKYVMSNVRTIPAVRNTITNLILE
ncbi:MAG: Lrp/AsnC family transcriptional regulator [Planctomycetes bacterium]|nr:Lrp/AsnC family transcriptional regulator [Planctomycetota bacterium]